MTDVVFGDDRNKGQAPPIGDLVTPGTSFHWASHPQLWDTLILAGQPWPGRWDINPSGERRDIDKKKAKGQHGNTIRDNGMMGGSVKIVGTIASNEYGEIKRLISLVTPRRPKGIRTPITISHPDCDLVGLSEIYIENIIPRGPKSGKDFWTVEIHAIQWFPQPKEVKKPKPEAIVSRAEANKIFQGLQQPLDPMGPQPEESFSESIGRLADRTNFIVGPDYIPPPYTEP